MSTWNAQDYASHSSAQQQWAQELIAKLQLGDLWKRTHLPFCQV